MVNRKQGYGTFTVPSMPSLCGVKWIPALFCSGETETGGSVWMVPALDWALRRGRTGGYRSPVNLNQDKDGFLLMLTTSDATTNTTTNPKLYTSLYANLTLAWTFKPTHTHNPEIMRFRISSSHLWMWTRVSGLSSSHAGSVTYRTRATFVLQG